MATATTTNEEKTANEEKITRKNHKWGKRNTNEEKPLTKKYFVEEKPQMKKNHKWRKPQMKKTTNVENFEEVTHEIEFMFFFTFRLRVENW